MRKPPSPRLTLPSLSVLKAFLDKRGFRASGADVMNSTKLASGTVYPILFRFEEAGWLKSEWESIDPTKEGRPRRRYYVLTGAGQRVAREALTGIGAASYGRAKWALSSA